jgi:hypothetical protein
MKLLKEIHQGRISFADPDHEPGAVEREGAAQDAAAGRHFNASEALAGDVATALDAKVKKWKEGTWSINQGREWINLSLPTITTKSGMKLNASIAHDSFSRGYSLAISSPGKRATTKFISSRELADSLRTLIMHDWEKATGAKIYSHELYIPVDNHESGHDVYYSPIRIGIDGPSAQVPTAKYIAGVKEIIRTLEMKL